MTAEQVRVTGDGIMNYGHGGDIWTAAESAGFSAEDILDFSANINPLGPPPGLLGYLTEKITEITRYPDPAARGFCSAVKKAYRLNGIVVPGNGAGELIYLLMHAVSPGPVLFPVPSFLLYEKAAAAAGCKIFSHMTYEDRQFRLDTTSFCDEIRQSRPKLVILCNPNNPTGTLLGRDEILDIARATRQAGGLVLVDEAFLEFCPDHAERTLLPFAGCDNIAVLCSLTKMFAIPGLRLGFLTGPAPLVRRIHALRDPWSVNSLAQRAGEYVLADRNFAEATAGEVSRLAKLFAGELAQMPQLYVYPPAANYIFIRSGALNADELQSALLKKKFMIRNCGNYRGLDNRYFRLAVRSQVDNEKLLSAMRRIRGGREK